MGCQRRGLPAGAARKSVSPWLREGGKEGLPAPRNRYPKRVKYPEAFSRKLDAFCTSMKHLPSPFGAWGGPVILFSAVR